MDYATFTQTTAERAGLPEWSGSSTPRFGRSRGLAAQLLYGFQDDLRSP